MNIYRAVYILNSDKHGELIDWFEFEQYKDDKWERTSDGYFRSEGWLYDRAEDGVQVNNSLCYAKNEKFFERELDESELKDLEVLMRKECIKALERKIVKSVMDLTNQINHIKKGIEL